MADKFEVFVYGPFSVNTADPEAGKWPFDLTAVDSLSMVKHMEVVDQGGGDFDLYFWSVRDLELTAGATIRVWVLWDGVDFLDAVVPWRAADIAKMHLASARVGGINWHAFADQRG